MDCNDKILEKDPKIYPINLSFEGAMNKIYIIGDWFDIFYTIKKGKMKQRFIEQMKNSEYSGFFKGLNYEYGINGVKKDLEEAFRIYKKSADNTTDSLAMFRMYHFYKNNYINSGLKEREKILELFYLFKCFCYLRYPIMQRRNNLFNRFDIKLEVLIHFDIEDHGKKKFPKFIKHLKENFKFYDINKSDVDLIERVINIQIILNNESDINAEILKLYELYTSNNNLEAYYKFICFNESLNDEYKEKEFNNLYNKKYYRSFIDYALLLNSKNKKEEALKILLEAKNNGIISAGFIYFDIFFDICSDFDLLFKEAIYFTPQCDLYFLLTLLIDDINIDNVYSFFEYFFLLKICFKHYNLEKAINEYFYDYTKEIVDFLISITKEYTYYNGKLLVAKYYGNNENYDELKLACGIMHFYGVKNILKKNLDKSLHFTKIAYENTKNESYKRFCYYYIFRINEIFYKEKKLKSKEKNQKKLNKNLLLVNDADIKKIRAKIFNDYYKGYKEYKGELTASYYYYLSSLYNKKIGNNGNKIMEIICLNKASEYINKNPGFGSIISSYRKYKAKKILEKNKEEFNKILNENIKISDSEGYGEKGDICPICFDKKRNMICYPCSHQFCDDCIYKVEKCPICRKPIMIRNKII